MQKHDIINYTEKQLPESWFKDGISGDGGGGCFPKGTKISTNIGLVNIEDISVGDKVLSFNQIGTLSYKEVTETYKHSFKEVCKTSPLVVIKYVGGQLTTTINHYIATPSKQSDETDIGFARADQLEKNDIIYLRHRGDCQCHFGRRNSRTY